MPDSPLSATLEIEVPFYDVDSCHIAWHGNYAKYLEVARCKLLDNIGYNYKAMQRDGYFYPIVKMQTKFVKPLLFGQVFLITATLIEWEYRLRINYTITDKKSGEKLTTAQTTQVCVDLETQDMQYECPETLHSIIRELTQAN